MDFFIVDLTGRHFKFENAVPDTTILDIKKFMAPKLKVDDEKRVILINQGQQLTDVSATLQSLGITAETITSTKFYALLKFVAPRHLFDGNCHPLVINDLPIGGPPTRPDIAESQCSLEKFLNELDLNLIDAESAATVDVELLKKVRAFEESDNILLPECLHTFLTRTGMAKICSSQLAFNPLVVMDADFMWGAPFYVHVDKEQHEHAVLFMMDHQGCGYWYAVWKQPDNHIQRLSDCSVYVLFGGQEFVMNETVYPTSRHFWQFLCDYASKPKLS